MLRRTGRANTARLLALCLLLALVALAACRVRIGGEPTPGGESNTASVEVERFWVQPRDGRAPLLREFAAARSTLDVVVYLLIDQPVIEGIIAAHQRGVTVRVMVEEDPFGGGVGNAAALKRLKAAGVEWKYGNPTYRYTHEKAVIVDRKLAVVMTANLTKSAFTRNREYLAVLTSPPQVREIQALFDADWRRTSYAPRQRSLVVSDANSRERLLALIGAAEKSLDIEAEVISDREIRAALVAAHQRGVTVRLIMSPPEPEESSFKALAELDRAGVGVRTVTSPYIHAKSILVDRQRAYVGSINFTANSMDQNRELGILTTTRDVIEQLGTTFDADWAKGRPLSGAPTRE